MKVLHLLWDGASTRADEVIAVHSRTSEVKVIDLSRGPVSYADVVDEIFAHDKVICW